MTIKTDIIDLQREVADHLEDLLDNPDYQIVFFDKHGWTPQEYYDVTMKDIITYLNENPEAELTIDIESVGQKIRDKNREEFEAGAEKAKSERETIEVTFEEVETPWDSLPYDSESDA